MGGDSAGVGLEALPFSLEWLRPPADWSAEAERLLVTSPAQTDWFIDPIGAQPVRTAPALVGTPPDGDYALHARVAVDGEALFDAAGLFVHDDDDHWAKLAVEITAAGPTLVSVVTRRFSDDCNSTALAESSAWLRLARIGDAIAFHASSGAGRWDLIRVFRLGRAAARIGFICQAPTGPGCTGTFDAVGFESRTVSDIRDGS